MKLVPDIAWRSAGGDAVQVDPRLLPLLREIRGRATLRAAAEARGMSYRAAWDLLGAQSRALDATLVTMVRGQGGRLAPFAERLLAADDAARKALRSSRPQLSLSTSVSRADSATGLRVAASHDLLLAEFSTAARLDLDIAFRGSLESVTAFAHGEVEVAGFHVLSDSPESSAAPYRSILNARRDRLIRFAGREQGLIVAPGNPRRVATLADVARKKLRFVNRQRGSGTRLLIDQLLRQSGVDPAKLRGYGEEEFTHVAVAATVAAGQADAGVGVRAAALRFGLAFIPLRNERYWLVIRRSLLEDTRGRRLTDALRGATLARLAKRLTGYDVRGAGEIEPLQALHGH
jgi:putative molybdopterin biosynthesis protein